MTDIDALKLLAVAAGIRTNFNDAWGKPAEVPEASLRALLAALGIAAHDDGAVRSSLASFEEGGGGEPDGGHVLAPVYVVRTGEAPDIAVPARQDGGNGGARIDWT